MGGGRWGWAAALATIAAGASACDDVGAPARGFHSRQLVSLRDPTLTLVGFGSKTVTVETANGPSSRTVTDPDIAHYATGYSPRIYWRMNLADGTVTELGDRIVSPQPPGSAERFDCRYEGTGAGLYTLVIADATTRQDVASIDRVVDVIGCPSYPDHYLAVVRLDENDVGRLWTGPFEALVRAELDLAIDRALRANWYYEPDPAKWRMTVLATAGPATAGRGIYAIDLAQLSAEAVIPPALPDVVWAPGGAPSGSVRSDGLALEDVAIVYGLNGNDTYLYHREMNDGSRVMFTGPLSAPASRELALFPIVGETTSVFLVAGGGFSTQGNVVTWQQIGASGSDTDLLVNWDTANQRIIPCPLARGTLLTGVSIPSTRLMGRASPDRSRYLFADAGALGVSEGDLFGPLVELSIAGAGSCTLLAAKDVKSAVIADEAVAWIEWPEDTFTQTLWLAGASGDVPRAVGSMTLLDAPTFIAANTLQVQLGTDVVWFDVRDDPVKLHYVAEGTFGLPTTGPRWVIVGYDLSSQDGTGTLGVVDWHTGEKRLISPAVEDYIASARDSSERPIGIVYRVRGRSASPLDGLWAATIDVGDLPD
jgi:hypothetical protein